MPSSLLDGSLPANNHTHVRIGRPQGDQKDDKDWKSVTDFAERRRIQNRIAQRNYRKRIKKKLEALEKAVKSSNTANEATRRASHSGIGEEDDKHFQCEYTLQKRESVETCEISHESCLPLPRCSVGTTRRENASLRQSSPYNTIHHGLDLQFDRPQNEIGTFDTHSRFMNIPTSAVCDTQHQGTPVFHSNIDLSLQPPFCGPDDLSVPRMPGDLTYGYSALDEVETMFESTLFPLSMAYASLAGIEIPRYDRS